MFFTSPDHRKRYVAAMQHIGKMDDGTLDAEYASALYILTSSAGLWIKASGYVSHEEIDVAAMLTGVDLSGGERVLALLVGNLFNGEQHGDQLELLRLDDSNFLVALTTIQVRRASLSHVALL
jgi:hypothetical protein